MRDGTKFKMGNESFLAMIRHKGLLMSEWLPQSNGIASAGRCSNEALQNHQYLVPVIRRRHQQQYDRSANPCTVQDE